MSLANDVLDEGLNKKTRVLTQYAGGGNAAKATVSTVDNLEAGIWKIINTQEGIQFVRHNISTDELLKFTDSRYNSILTEMDNFWKLQNQYEKLKFTHKRGVMLSGRPGVGKSCLLKQTMEKVVNDGNIVFIGESRNLDAMSNGLKQFREVEPDRKALVVIEDVDESVGWGERTLLELLDGDSQMDGFLYLGTTNYIEKLPERYLRANRFDRKIKVVEPPVEGVKAYLKHKIGSILDEDKLDNLAEKLVGFTFAQLREFLVATQIMGETDDKAIARLKSNLEESMSDFDKVVYHTELEEADFTIYFANSLKAAQDIIAGKSSLAEQILED